MQDANTEPSRAQSVVAPASAANTKLAPVAFVGLAGLPPVIETVGAVVSIVQV